MRFPHRSHINQSFINMIGVIGPGRLGICFSLLLEQAGYPVMVSDIRRDYVDSINSNTIESNEPYVVEFLKQSKKITAVYDNTTVIDSCDIIFVIVPTPSLPNGRYDISALESIVNDFKNVHGKILVITSTTNPGDCERFQEQLTGNTLLYNPEFIAQGSIIRDIQKADILLIGGSDEHAISKIIKLYESIQDEKPDVHIMSLTAAEIVKVAINCYLTTKISYANILGQVMIAAGLETEIDLALTAIGKDSRIGTKYLKFGHGFGGPCLPRDNRSFGMFAKSLGIEFNLGSQIDEFNREHLEFLTKFYISKNTHKIPFYFKYVSYKEHTDIFEESQQLALCKKLLSLGYEVCIEDSYLIDKNLKNELKDAGANFIKKNNFSSDMLSVDL